MGAEVKRKAPAKQAKPRQVVGHKGGAKKPKQPSIASNSVPSISTARLVYLWSWGPIVGPVDGLRSVKLDGTPIMAADGSINYPGVKWQFRSGELHQDRLEGVTESSNEIQVSQELRSTTPWVYSINNPVIDAVRVRFSWPVLQAQDSSGNIDGVHIDYAIDVSTDGGQYQQVLASSVSRKNVTKYERSHRVELPEGSSWTVRARRLTPEANSSLVQDAMIVEAIAEVVDSDQEYPLTAVGCVEYDAQQFGGDFPKIAVLMRGRIVRVPMNYDPETRTYATGGAGTTNGVWDGSFKEAYTNNPAWVFYDLALHPYYGLGDRIDASMINRWSLYRIAQWCDQLVPDGKGGQEPRFTCNLYLQKQAEAWAVLQDLAAIFHGLAYWDGSQIAVNADMPQDPVYTYTTSQILGDGVVKYSGSKWRDRHSLAMVSFDDPDQGFETDKEPVFDEDAMAEYGVRDVSVEAVGCTSRGQAQRAGKWALLTEQLQIRGATINVGLDGYIPKPGTVVALSDPMLAGRANGGRIAAVAGRVVTLDRDVEVPTAARLLVNLPSGKTESRQVRSVSGRQITVMADYSETPQPECGWAIDYDDLKLMQFYVRNVTRPEWTRFQLDLIQHEPSKFDAVDHGTMIDDRPISVLPPGVQEPPARVLISSHSAVDQGIALTTMTIGWDAAPDAVAYDVEWRWNSRDWVKVPRTGELAVDVRGVYAGQYLARVRAVNAMDVASIPTASMLTDVEGKTTPPPAVSFLRTVSEIYGIRLEWGFPAGAEDTAYTQVEMSSESSGMNPLELGLFGYPTNTYLHSGMAAAVVRYFRARLVDRSGNVGPWTEWIYGQSSADASAILDYITGKITETQLGQDLLKEIEKISGQGPGSVNDRITAGDTALQGQIDSLQSQLADVVGAPDWNENDAYLSGSLVKLEGKLYRAKQDVPAGTPVTNETFWEYIGDYASLGELVTALAIRVDAVETRVEEVDGELQAMATRVIGVETQVFPRMAGATSWKAGDSGVRAAARSIYSAFSNADMALSRRIDIVEAQVGDDLNARFEQEAYARVTADEALATQITTVSAKTDDNEASLQQEITARTTADEAMTAQITAQKSRIDGNEAAIASEAQTRATADQALAASVTQLTARVGDTEALVEDTASAVVDLEGNVSATRNIKVGVDVNGRYYGAGMGIGVENTPEGMQSTVIFLADLFAVMHQPGGNPKSVFALQNGQAIINSEIVGESTIGTANIANAAITEAKIQNLAVSTAKIADLAVNTGKIADLAVDTLKIAGRAVTLPVSYYSAGVQSVGGISGAANWATISTITYISTGQPALMNVSNQYCGTFSWPGGYWRLLIDGVVVTSGRWLGTSTSSSAYNGVPASSISLNMILNMASGSRTVTFQMSPDLSPSAVLYTDNRAMTIMEVKR
ncbi:putative phage tail protein [Pseudomonas sp. 2848]|uniref:TipJ family phage tail tip protein n=1 Tax=Pseudomonas sp. 2848 TaxID=2183926 RepID=UPI000DABDF23|nr:phage tail protein [Pseudomonas sp. 2848]PZW76598.1 putative phage tail protein [Pseudomonas sp. 2848]